MQSIPKQLAQQNCDLLIVGGGINGAGIARDAAGRGLRVILCEQHDLAQHTSSASTKLIHGGLRYLEYYEFKLVRKALQEREVLLRAAPHIMWPLRFVMPHDAGQRPAWMIRAGLFIYDHLARREFLPASEGISLQKHVAGSPLKGNFRQGFEYSDGWVDDARLVVLNALDASEHGANILTRTKCVNVQQEGKHWLASLSSEQYGHIDVSARAIVNAAGPWTAQFANASAATKISHGMRLVKGSHIIVPRLFEHPYAYIFQNPDKRIIFAIPYQDEFTLIGTTDLEYTDDPEKVQINDDEINYLCLMANRYFTKQISASDVVWSFSGVRPLLEDSSQNASAVTRDYRLEFENIIAPFLNVWGGKITTYRKLSEEVLDILQPCLGSEVPTWTAAAPLPGGDLQQAGTLVASYDFDSFSQQFCKRYPWLPTKLAQRYARCYGTRATRMLGAASKLSDMGEELTPGMYETEARYLMEVEWGAQCRRHPVAQNQVWPVLPAATGGTATGVDEANDIAIDHTPNLRTGDVVKLELKQISLRVGAETYLHPLDLELTSGGINVLLGPTQAGKTSLMRVIAGLDHPNSGQILVDGKDMVGISVRERNLSMVYQQFVNYPAMTVYENIAAPLRLQRFPKDEIQHRVHEIAEKLHINHLLQRMPGALSGGQQQRCALARALVKRAPLVLLDEPLVNLDYKLREELRMELTSLFIDGDTTVVYATTEPQEALLLGGHTVIMDAGRILQTGATLATYNQPVSIRAAAIFNDPPMNILDASIENNQCIRLNDGTLLNIAAPELDLPKGRPCKVGIRSHHVQVTADSSRSNLLNCTVDLAELSGSELLCICIMVLRSWWLKCRGYMPAQ